MFMYFGCWGQPLPLLPPPGPSAQCFISNEKNLEAHPCSISCLTQTYVNTIEVEGSLVTIDSHNECYNIFKGKLLTTSQQIQQNKFLDSENPIASVIYWEYGRVLFECTWCTWILGDKTLWTTWGKFLLQMHLKCFVMVAILIKLYFV